MRNLVPLSRSNERSPKMTTKPPLKNNRGLETLTGSLKTNCKFSTKNPFPLVFLQS